MATLEEQLQQTINNLEKIRDSKKPPPDDVLASLDTLYQQQLDLIGAAITEATKGYADTTAAMTAAAVETEKAIDDLAKLAQSIEKVAAAISAVAGLLAKVAA